MLEIYTQIQTLAVSMKQRFEKEDGQTMAEYGVVLGVITVFLIGAFTLLSGDIEALIKKVGGILKTAA